MTYVVMGYTRGDDLIASQAKPLFASADWAECEVVLERTKRERDEWLAKYEGTVPPWQRCAIYSRFEIVETPILEHPPQLRLVK